MQEIIREAITLVDPNAEQEAVDPKGKKGGKTPNESEPSKELEAHKEIATLILSQIQLTTGDKEKLPGKNVDLVSLISDDNLLVQLFCSKLKLFYKDKVHTPPNLRDKIQKEKELLEQLEEAKNGEPADDPKAKGKKAGKSLEEIEAEIKVLL